MTERGWHKHKNADGTTTYTRYEGDTIANMQKHATPQQKEKMNKELRHNPMPFKQGVNSFKMSKDGKHFTIKLSKTTAKAIATTGTAAAGGLFALLGPLWGYGASIATSLANVYGSGSIKNGVVGHGVVKTSPKGDATPYITSWGNQ